MFDIFYQGNCPELGLNERQAENIGDAQSRAKTRFFWWVHYLADLDGWDWLWEPPPWQADQRHAWADQHQPDSGVYLIPTAGFTDTNYHNDRIIHRLADQSNWIIPEWIDAASIDPRWSPDPASPPYLYEFPVEWGWRNVGGPVYQVPGAVERKFVSDFVARTQADGVMQISDHLAQHDAVLRWRPNPTEPPYIYVFGNQWWPAEKRASAIYAMPGARDHKYMDWPRAQRQSQPDRFVRLQDCDFDMSWEPDPGDPAYIYVFGNQWWSAEKMPTVEYHVPGATERKFMSAPVATLAVNPNDYWVALEDCDWDRTWRPDPGDPAYIYVFGNQWWPAETWPTLEYHVPGATERKYVSSLRARLLPDRSGWTVPEGIDPESVDYSWRPDPGSPAYIYQFGTQWQKTGGAIYTMPGATEIKYVSAFRCRKISQDPHWHLPQDLRAIMADFDWTWHPDATEQPYIYEFGSQHQKTGGPEYHVPGGQERKYVEQVKVEIKHSRAPVVVLDHMDGNATDLYKMLIQKMPVIKTVRYVNNYLDTLTRIAATVDAEWIWIASSVCDYQAFDWTWYPEQWQATMLHVFASDDLKFGDTFFMHVPTFRERASRCKLLEWYDVNFVDQSVPRRPLPVISHTADTHVEEIKAATLRAPLTLFTTDATIPRSIPAVNIWRDEVKAVTPLDPGACSVIVPREVSGRVHTQVYDYPVIDKTHRTGTCRPLDIVFISNGEPNADEHWRWLLEICQAQSAPNRVVRVDGVNGRAAAYRNALSESQTPWAFCVFAKLEVAKEFDWAWQPDRLQQPKHYIFHAVNPKNGLVYGHQSIIAYNKELVMINAAEGLDFTLDQPHEVVPKISGTAHYAATAWMAWRTAFREALKLQHSLPDVENQYRLDRWLTEGWGVNGEWSVQGAQDAVDYYREVGGDFQALKKSYEWAWLSSYAMFKRGLVPD